MSTISTAVQNLVEIPPWGLLKYNPKFFIYLSDSPTGQTARQIFTLD